MLRELEDTKDELKFVVSEKTKEIGVRILDMQEGWPEDLAGRAMGLRGEALNLLDFFGSFFCQEKNERKASLPEKVI